MAVGIRDVAAVADVSIQTVSNVLNGRPGASEPTRQRVLEAAARLGYARPPQAPSPRKRRSDRIGLLVATSDPTFPADAHQAHIFAGITEQLLEDERASWRFVVSQQDRPTAADFALFERGTIGVAVVALFLPKLACLNWIEALEQGGWPCVLVDQLTDAPGLACVISDQQQGALEATGHLLRQGHRQIALLTGGHDKGEFQERRLGYNRAMALWGLAATERTIVETDGTIVGGYEAVTALLKGVPRPTAIVAVHDLLALGAMEAARTAGLTVPGDMAVVGFEDMDFAAHIEPALTSVRLPARNLGVGAARLALAYLRDGGFAQRKVIFPTSLHVRSSSVANGADATAPVLYHVNGQAAPFGPPLARTGPFRIGVSLISLDNPWRLSMHEQLQLTGEREPEISALLVRDAGASLGQQVQDIRDLIAQRVDALIVDPGGAEPLVPLVEEAAAAGIPVVMLASTVPTDRYTTKVGPDEVMVGRIVAEDLLQRMGPGNLVVLEGPQGWPVVEERSRGMALVLRQHRDVRVLATASVPQWSRQRAKEIMRDWLLLFPTINGVLAHDGLMAMGALEAAQEAGCAEDLHLGMVGTYNRALQYIATTGQGKSVLIPTWIGTECVQVALRILHGEHVPKWWNMGVTVITKENVFDWYDPSKLGDAFDSLIHE